MLIRLQKYLRDVLGVSRRKAEEIIIRGEVMVNGGVAKIGLSVDGGKDSILYQGRPVEQKEKKHVYIMLHKPSGYVTTRDDPEGRETVYSLLPRNMKSLFSVGRLDCHTEGLLLFTNDGDFTEKITHPKYKVEKEYYVLLNAELRASDKQQIERGIQSSLITTAPACVTILKTRRPPAALASGGKNNMNPGIQSLPSTWASKSSQTTLLITVHEGQNREIRKIFEHLCYRVLYLKRVRIGKILLGDLPKGTWRNLTNEEISLLVAKKKNNRQNAK